MAQRQFRTSDTDRWRHGFGNKYNKVTVSSNSALANEYAVFSGVAGGKPALASFNNNDLLLIHNTRGVNAADAVTWELNRKKAGELEYELTRSYLNTDENRSQIIKALVCKEFKLTSGAILTITPWDLTKGGLGVIIADTIDLSGGDVDLRSLGFYGGDNGGDYAGARGESWLRSEEGPYAGFADYRDNGYRVGQANAGGSGSGTNSGSETQPGAGGAANKNNGSNGSKGTSTYSGTAGQGGIAAGSDDLKSLVFPAGGSQGAGFTNGTWYPGGKGGRAPGSLICICRVFKAPQRIYLDGTNSIAAGHANSGGGSASAGGNFLVMGMDIDLGTDVITALAGTSGTRAGASSIGRIAAIYSRAVAGDTNPDAYTEQDMIFEQFPRVGGALLAAI